MDAAPTDSSTGTHSETLNTISDTNKVKLPKTFKFTPLVEIQKIQNCHGFNCRLFVKCAFQNESGLASQHLGYQLLDIYSQPIMPLTWNRNDLGLGICYAAATRRNPSPVFLKTSNQIPPSRRLSRNDSNILRCLGTRIVCSPSRLDYQTDMISPPLHLFKSPVLRSLSEKLADINPNIRTFTEDQYGLTLQPDIIQSLFEIVSQTHGPFDLLVCDISTTRIILANKLFHRILDKYDVACVEDDHASSDSCALMNIKLEVPENLHRIKVSREAARAMTYELLNEEGILCSVKSGQMLAGAITAARSLGHDKKSSFKVITLLPEGLLHEPCFESLEYDWLIRNNIWTAEHMELKFCWWWNVSIPDFGLKPIGIIYPGMTIDDAIGFMKQLGVDRVGIDFEGAEEQKLAGVAFLSTLEAYINCDDLEPYEEREGDPGNQPITEIMSKSLAYGDINDLKMSEIAHLLTYAEYLVVTLKIEKNCDLDEDDGSEPGEISRIIGIVAPEDLIKYKKKTLLEHLDLGYFLKG